MTRDRRDASRRRSPDPVEQHELPTYPRSYAMTLIAHDPLQTLRRRLSGTILEPGAAAWESAAQAYNLTVVQQPALIALPADARDVVAIVEFARENGYQVAPQRTGHNAEPL